MCNLSVADATTLVQFRELQLPNLTVSLKISLEPRQGVRVFLNVYGQELESFDLRLIDFEAVQVMMSKPFPAIGP